MRFYLDFPLVAGYVLMATTACLGMLQFVAARGGYVGLSLFSINPRRGTLFGLGLTVVALLAYVLFAPYILTPGPAGSEVAEIFALCATAGLFVTLLGADLRWRNRAPRRIDTNNATKLKINQTAATLFQPHRAEGKVGSFECRWDRVHLYLPAGIVHLAHHKDTRGGGRHLKLDVPARVGDDACLRRRSFCGRHRHPTLNNHRS